MQFLFYEEVKVGHRRQGAYTKRAVQLGWKRFGVGLSLALMKAKYCI